MEQKEAEDIWEMKNPFTPNFGREPAVLAGRRKIMEELDQAFRNAPDALPFSSIFVGASGTGKTAMLTHYGRELSAAGWVVVNVSCGRGMLEDIYLQTLKNAQYPAEDQKEEKWQPRMTDVVFRLGLQGRGLLITIDELIPRQEEMTEFLHAYRSWTMEKRKIALLMAGLPRNVSNLLKKEHSPFLYSMRQGAFAGIPDGEIRKAFEETVRCGGKEIEPDALQRAVSAIGGYPFMLQLVGYRSFFYAGDREKITEDDIVRGIKAASEDFKTGTLKPALDGLSDMDIRFLVAMAKDAGASSPTDIAERLGKAKSYIHQYKRRLIRQGIIHQNEKGLLAFSLPGMRDYLEESWKLRSGLDG